MSDYKNLIAELNFIINEARELSKRITEQFPDCDIYEEVQDLDLADLYANETLH